MQTTAKNSSLIEKEVIPSLHFSKDDVLTEPQEQRKRLWDINRAMTLGNGYHGKVAITFKTAEGELKRVDTTVWAFDQDFITLKAGCSIPLRSIVGIEFF